jgi:hypothetical protein
VANTDSREVLEATSIQVRIVQWLGVFRPGVREAAMSRHGAHQARYGTFAYWRTSYADSPAPQVMLRYRDGIYRMAADLMRKPAPAPTELSTRARQIQQGKWSEPCPGPPEYPCPPSGLWSTMLDLLYTGHAVLAWQFFDTA